MTPSTAYTTLIGWMPALLLVWTLLLFGGFLVGRPDEARTRRLPLVARLGSSFTLVIAAWSWFALARGTPAASYALLLAAGMTLGYLGDLFMAGLMGTDQPVAGGIVAFGLGHLFYIAGGIGIARHPGLEADPRWTLLAPWMLLAILGWYAVVYQPAPEPTALHWAALPYALLLATTAGVGTVLLVQSLFFLPLAIGSALFLLSDLVLATQLFNDSHFLYSRDFVWFTYGSGQALIVFSVAGALAALMGGIL